MNEKLLMTNAELQTAIDQSEENRKKAADNGAWRWENHLERLLETQRERAALMHCASNEELSDTKKIESAIGALTYHRCNPFLTKKN